MMYDHKPGFPGSSVVKNMPANAGDVRDTGLIPGSGRSPGKGNGYPLKYSCLENSRDRGAWRATVHGVAQSFSNDLTTKQQKVNEDSNDTTSKNV